MPQDSNNFRLWRDPTHEPSDPGSPPLEYHDGPDGGGSDPSSHGDDQLPLSRCSSQHSSDVCSLRFEDQRLSRLRQPSCNSSRSSQHDNIQSNRSSHHRQSHSRSRLRARPSTNYSTEISPHRSVYLRDIHHSYHQLIDEQVKIPLHTVNSGIKLSSIQVPLPKVYSGDEDIEQFDGWLHSMLQWMKINHYTGPECEHDCIMLTAMYLDERAKTWFNNNVKGVNHWRRVWTFKDIITGLYDRFIHESSIQDATQKFYSVKYTTDGGVFRF